MRFFDNIPLNEPDEYDPQIGDLGVSQSLMEHRLMRQIYQGNALAAIRWLDAGAKINALVPLGDTEDDGDTTPLIAASRLGDVRIMQILLDRGANINKQNDFGESPLLVAVESANIHAVKMLLERKCNVEIQDNSRRRPLMKAAGLGLPDIVKLLIEAGANVNAKNNLGYSILHSAMYPRPQRCMKQIVQMLLDKGANIDDRSYLGWTPLMSLIKNAETFARDEAKILELESVAKLLLERGTTLEETNTFDKSPLDFALALRGTIRFANLIRNELVFRQRTQT